MPGVVSESDEKHVIFVADKVYDKMDDRIPGGLSKLDDAGVTTHWVLIGTNQTVPTNGKIVRLPGYHELDINPIPYFIMEDILVGKY